MKEKCPGSYAFIKHIEKEKKDVFTSNYILKRKNYICSVKKVKKNENHGD